MKCPKCMDRAEVLETRPTSTHIRRRRRCLNPRCEHRFTTTETTECRNVPSTDEAAVRARALAREFGSRVVDREALEAALAVDMRRAEIARRQRRERKEARDAWYEPDAFEPAPLRLNRESLKRELGEY